MLEHGGRLRAAAAHYNIPLASWLDLSTGLNPEAWPVPALPASIWQRLPETGDGLEEAAASYYGNANLLPVPRSLAVATPYVLLCNPNNPTADRHPHEVVIDAARQLKKRGGWLIVDEAFVDAMPELSLTPLAGSEEAPNLIVFRSLGKFFGLAGARVGFVFAAPDLLNRMSEAMGPWTISGPSREVARQALLDAAWQDTVRPRLLAAGER